MVTRDEVAKIERLLADSQFSQRQIAVLTGHARGTIAAIARGDWAGYHRLPATGERRQRVSGPPQRCGQCGATVYGECHACRLRSGPAGAGQIFRADPEGPLALDLRPAERARYEEIHRRKQRDTEEADAGLPEPKIELSYEEACFVCEAEDAA